MKKNTGKAPSIQFYYKDFLADMSEHDPDIVGAWMLVLIKIWHTDNGGSVTKTLSQFAKIMNTDQVGARRFIDYFRAENIANVTDDNDKITIVNRRSKRDFNLRERNKLRQEKFRKKDGKFGNNTNITPMLHHPSSSSSSSSSTSNNKTYSQDSNEYRLASLLFNLILQRNPGHKKPDLQKWAVHTDRMVRLDKREVKSIEDVIRWAQASDFWHKNILGTEKLRDKYDQLTIQMKADGYKPADTCYSCHGTENLKHKSVNDIMVYFCPNCEVPK